MCCVVYIRMSVTSLYLLVTILRCTYKIYVIMYNMYAYMYLYNGPVTIQKMFYLKSSFVSFVMVILFQTVACVGTYHTGGGSGAARLPFRWRECAVSGRPSAGKALQRRTDAISFTADSGISYNIRNYVYTYMKKDGAITWCMYMYIYIILYLLIHFVCTIICTCMYMCVHVHVHVCTYNMHVRMCQGDH